MADKDEEMKDVNTSDEKKKAEPKKKAVKDKEEVLVKNSVEINPKLEEEAELDEALTLQQRRQRALTMRKYKSKIAAGRKRNAKRISSKERLQKKARKKAINIIRAKVAGKKGADYKELSAAEKMMIDKRVAKRKGAIDRIAKKILPQVRKADIARISGKKLNEDFELMFERQDPDIKDREGTQPAKYHAGLSKSTKEKRDAHFKKGAKMDDDNPAAYKPAPGDAEAKTKESQYTKKYKAMYGEEVTEASQNDEKPKKRYHEARKKDGSIKLDRRFRAFKSASKPMTENATDSQVKAMQQQHKRERNKLSQEHEREMDRVKTRVLRKQIRNLRKEEAYFEEFSNDAEVLAFIEETANDIFESIELDEEKSKKGLAAKAEKSGISLSILKKVYDRGVAAWRTGHRPGTTPQQWGFARVNSFITGGKTRTTADKDLWAKHKGKSESVNELEEQGALWWHWYSKQPKRLKPAAEKKYKNHLELFKRAEQGLKKYEKGSDPYIRSQIALKHHKQEMDKMLKSRPLLKKFVGEDMGEAVSPVQQAAIAISKKEKAGKPGYDKEGKRIKEDDDPCWDGYKQLGMKKKNGKEVPNCVKEDLDSFFDLDEAFELAEASIQDRAIAAVHKHVQMGKELSDIVFDVSRAAGVNMTSRELERAYIAKHGKPKKVKVNPAVRARLMKKFGMKSEAFGAGFEGTDTLIQNYKEQTPGEKGKKKEPKVSDWSPNINEAFEDMLSEEVTQKQIQDLEKFADRLLDKFDVDVEFTRHFADRMNDSRNNPKITIPELQRFFKKVAKNKAKDIKANVDAEAVLKDIQADLNLPVVIKFNRRKGEIEVVNKTIMRKKDFKTSNKVIKY